MKTLQDFFAIWKRLGINQKVTIALLLMALVGAIVALVVFGHRPDFELLYADLGQKDLAHVVSFLKESDTPYRIVRGGTAVMVPSRLKNDLRLTIADKDIIDSGHVDLRIWETPRFGTSEMGERMLKRKALQGELARTITHLAQVLWADVQIAQPEPSLFVEDEQPATAAITLRLRPGDKPTRGQISGIQRFVAYSVEGLRTENVTVIDGRGNILSGSQTADVGFDQDAVHTYEASLARKAQSMLDKVLGPGKAIVKVSAVLDPEEVSETHTEYDLDGKWARTEKILSKPVFASAADAKSGSGQAEREESTEAEYEVPKTTRTIRKNAGSVTHLAVALTIDPTYIDENGEEKTRPDEEIQALAEAVNRAVGLIETPPRNDTFQVTKMRFTKTAGDAGEDEIQRLRQREFILSAVKYSSTVVCVLIFLLFARSALKRMSAAPIPAPRPLRHVEAERVDGIDGKALERQAKKIQLRKRVIDAIHHDPASAARLLEHWLSEK